MSIIYFLGDSPLGVFHCLKEHLYVVLPFLGILALIFVIHLKHYAKKG
ncbi:MAG: hypothetical protein ACTTH5_07555 [Wolinella sp.]